MTSSIAANNASSSASASRATGAAGFAVVILRGTNTPPATGVTGVTPLGLRSLVEDLTHPASDGVRGERFLHVGGAGLEHAVPSDGIVGVARHENHPGVGAQVHQPAGELAAVETR